MFYRIIAPPSFFEASNLPQICPFSGSTQGLQPYDLDLSFIRAASPKPRLFQQAVQDLVAEAEVTAAPGARMRKGSGNVLLTIPVEPGAPLRWRFIQRMMPLILLAGCPLAAMATALRITDWLQANVVLGIVTAGLALGILLAWIFRRFNRPHVFFGVTKQGNVQICFDESLRAVADAYQVRLRSFLAGPALNSPASVQPPVPSPVRAGG